MVRIIAFLRGHSKRQKIFFRRGFDIAAHEGLLRLLRCVLVRLLARPNAAKYDKTGRTFRISLQLCFQTASVREKAV
jgi:hypothetical protein